MRDRTAVISGMGIDTRCTPGHVRHVRQRVRHGVWHQTIDLKGCASCAAYTYVRRARAHALAHVCADARASMPHMAHIPHNRVVMRFVGAQRGALHAAQCAAVARVSGLCL